MFCTLNEYRLNCHMIGQYIAIIKILSPYMPADTSSVIPLTTMVAKTAGVGDSGFVHVVLWS